MLSNYSTYTDTQLCELLKQGDRDAFTSIYEKYWQEMYQKARSLLELHEKSEDIVQDIFVNLWTIRAECEIEDLRAYLMGSVRNRALNHLQRDLGSETFFQIFEEIQSPDIADGLTRKKEFFELLRLYIDSLPAKRKEIFLLRYQSHLNTREIADLTGIPFKTVQNQLLTAKNGLRATVMSILIITSLLNF